MLNASNGRIYNLQLSDGRPFHLIGTDGGLRTEPHELTELPLSPGERAEILVDPASWRAGLVDQLGSKLHLDAFERRASGGDDAFDLLQLRAGAELTPAPPLPTTLASDELPLKQTPYGLASSPSRGAVASTTSGWT